jgi:putative hydrolase of the HAD superfamily
MAITTILLDVGGVIIDETEQEFVRARIITEVISLLEPNYSIERYYDDIDEAVKSFCPDTYKYVFWKHSHYNERRFDEMYQAHLNIWEEKRPLLKLAEGFCDFARQASQTYKLGMAGQYGKEILDLLSRSDILDCFAHKFTRDDFTITKPDPRYFEQILSKIQARPEQCIMIGDRIDKDIIPAKQLGMKTILIRTGLHKNQYPRVPSECPNVEIRSIKMFSYIIGNLDRDWE